MTDEAWIVLDLGFGDAGKGATVDYLVRNREAGLVVRFNGGAQAGHNVVTAEGRHHTFAQLGAGTFVDGVKTLLGPRFVLHPGALLREDSALRDVGIDDAFARLLIDRRALVVSPFHQAACRLRELARGDYAHGTCGVGIGEAVRDGLAGCGDTIRAANIGNAGAMLERQRLRIRQQIAETRDHADPRAAAEWVILDDPRMSERVQDLWRPLAGRLQLIGPEQTRDAIYRERAVIFEGAQGVLLDQDLGFHPHTTWSDCTPRGALDLLEDSGARVHRLGVLRARMVRHGPGPLPTFDAAATRNHHEPHNDDRGWQGAFRVGALDLVLLRYSLAVCGGVDGLAITYLDHITGSVPICDAYQIKGHTVRSLPVPEAGDHRALEELGQCIGGARPVIRHIEAARLVHRIEAGLGVPAWLIGKGPTADDRTWAGRPPVS